MLRRCLRLGGIRPYPIFMDFLCHYALDRVAHPYIYATQYRIIKARHIWYLKGVVHNQVEYEIDMLMLHRHLQVVSRGS